MSENAEKKDEVVEEKKPEVVDAAKSVEAPNQYAGGEIHIIADGKTGAINVSAQTSDLVVSLGLLEMAKLVLIDNMKQKVAQVQRDNLAAIAARRAIVPANAGQLKDLDRRLGRGAQG